LLAARRTTLIEALGGEAMWATDVMEMPDAEAIRPDRRAPDLVEREH
jgi:hypothetical protein